MTHHLTVVSDVPTNLVAMGLSLKAETEKVAELKKHEVKKIEDKNTTRIVDAGDFKITVTSVGTLDMKKFIEMAMNLPSFYK